MKKILKKILSIFIVISIFGNYFLTILPVQATESEVTAKITMKVNGSELEYNTNTDNSGYIDSNLYFVINKNKDSDTFKFKTNQVDYSRNSDEEIIGFETDEINYKYNGDTDDTKVTFTFYTSWDDVITSLKINGKTCTVPKTKQELSNAFKKDNRRISFDVEVDIDPDDEYEIVIQGRKQTESELYMGNFLWTYNKSDNVSDDEKIPHGILEFVEAEYNNHIYSSISEINNAGNIYQWKDGEKKSKYTSDDIETRTGIGEAMFPTGTELTLKLIPDVGYQLINLRQNDQSLQVGDEIGTYTFTIEGGNFHLGAIFEKVENVVNTSNSDTVESGNIDIDINNESSFEYGTAKLEVSDADPDTKDDFEQEVPEGYEIDNYLDISLYNTVYKGVNDSESSWDTEIDELENKATITLEMTDDMNGKDIKVIHELHDESNITGYEVIDATYDEENNTISFKTDGFSNYAIISKESNNEDYEVSDSKGNKIEFNSEKGHTYIFDMINYIEITDEELEALGMTRETYNLLLSGIKNATKKYGNILGIYEIIVVDESDNGLSEGPFKIKIKITDDMKDYNAFSIIYTDVDNDFTTDEPINLEVEGEFLVGTLEHLSVYTLVGYNTTSTENPKTNDEIISSVILGSVSLISLVACGLYIKKKKKFN